MWRLAAIPRALRFTAQADLGRAQPRRPDEDLEQDLEPRRAERLGVEYRATHDEEAAHRVAHTPQAAGEDPAGEGGEAPGDHVPGGPEAVAAAAAHVAGGA